MNFPTFTKASLSFGEAPQPKSAETTPVAEMSTVFAETGMAFVPGAAKRAA